MHELPEFQELFERHKRLSEQTPFINIADLAATLGVSVRTVRRRQRDGLLPERVRQSRKLVYRKADLADVLDATNKKV